MPLYIVRWPRAEASIVRANNEEHLRDILDELADPSCARWELYDGPLWIDFDLPTIPAEVGGDRKVDADAALGDDGGITFRVGIGSTDTTEAMRTTIASWAFPRLQAVVEERADALSGPIKRALSDEEAHWRNRFERALVAELEDMQVHLYRGRVERGQVKDPEQRTLLELLGVSKPPPWLAVMRRKLKRKLKQKRTKPKEAAEGVGVRLMSAELTAPTASP